MLKTNKLHDAELIKILGSGGVGVLPTDTVYGLVCSARNKEAVARLYALKSRDKKPGTVIAASVEQLVDLGLKARYLKNVAQYWPNPISIIIPSYELTYIHAGVGSIAVRIPNDLPLQQLLVQSGPLVTSSANHPGKPEATSITAAEDYFGNAVDFFIDGGDLSDRKASTLIRVVDDAVEVLRKGAVTINDDGTIG